MLCIDCGIAWWSWDLLECRIYTTNVEMALRLTLGTLQIQSEHWFCQRQLSHYTQSRTLFYLWRSREWLTLSSVLEIVHYYDVCPFTIFFSWPSWSYGSWIYNYLCNQCLSVHHLCCEFEFWFSPNTPVSATNTIISDNGWYMYLHVSLYYWRQCDLVVCSKFRSEESVYDFHKCCFPIVGYSSSI
jgi:hypothetical protein